MRGSTVIRFSALSPLRASWQRLSGLRVYWREDNMREGLQNGRGSALPRRSDPSMVILPEELNRANRKQSLAGGLCQLSGVLLAVVGGSITIVSVLNGGGLAGLLVGGSATFALALAGAPIAALGSIANSQKASKELLFLYVSESVTEPPRRRRPEGWSRWEPEDEPESPEYGDELEPEELQGSREDEDIPPPPPPPARLG
jgi:hypothetical protein